jgi:ATP-binding cassette, subfamily C (CFTR/MRP), member 1
MCAPVWSPIITFCTYAGLVAKGDGTLTIAKAFTAYALLTLVSTPLSNIIICLPVMAAATTSCQRIQDHLNGKSHVDNRITAWGEQPSDAHGQGAPQSVSSSGPGYELTDLAKKRSDIPPLGSDLIASVRGKFSWAEDAEPVLDIDKWDIRRQSFTMVLGPVGCGKSTLLKSLLGELSSFDGDILTSYSGASYCAQSAWLPNDSVRNIILGLDDFDETWYHTVIEACVLEEDMRIWPGGDQVLVGTKGIAMSGGQKHRLVCLPRLCTL